ncbi:hypothetical protein BD779DRAFT_1525594 [Infundibulicybe gibba]|nr:hypothetical protein BD779DRAFT_1525594 [Infundibulicybe gibba]
MELESEPEEVEALGLSIRSEQMNDIQMKDIVPNPQHPPQAHADGNRRSMEEPAIAGSRPKATRKTKLRNRKPCQPGRPQWTFTPPAANIPGSSCSPTLPPSRPRIWASHRPELLSTLPELAGSSCVHGVSWLLSPAPLILLEGQTAWGDVSSDGLTMDIIMARDFECCTADIVQRTPPSAEDDAKAPITAPTGPEVHLRGSERSSTPGRRFDHTTPLRDGRATDMRSASQPLFTCRPLAPAHELRNFTIPGGGQQPAPVADGIELGHHTSGEDISPPVIYGGHEPGVIPSSWFSPSSINNPQPSGILAGTSHIVGPMLCPEFDDSFSMKTDCRPLPPIGKVETPPGHSDSGGSISVCQLQEVSTTHPHPVVPSMPHQEPPTTPSHPKRRRGVSETDDKSIANSASVDCNTPALDQAVSDGDRFEKKVPAPIPPEIQTILDTYIHGLPIVIIANREHLPPQWNMRLPEEYAYVYLGYYQVIRVWEEIGEVGFSKFREPELGIISGHVDWRFRCRWISGGEDWVGRENKHMSPWWIERSHTTAVPPNVTDSDQESSPHYRTCRTKSPNYPNRHKLFGTVYHPLIPLHLIAPYGTNTPDTAFPRGWYCDTCGKINFQVMLRHRNCSSSFCRTKPPSLGFALGLATVRDPQDSLILFSPHNTYPPGVVETTTKWDDGSSTITYTAPTANVPLTVQHIFTCNIPILQEEPSGLFQAIQTDIKLSRSSGDASPYFACSVGLKKVVDGVVYSWRSAPRCLNDVRDFLHFRGHAYGEKDQTVSFINSLQIFAWVTSGTRRGTDLLDAKNHCVLILCLGGNTVLTVIPQSTLNKTEEQAPDPNSLNSMDIDDVGDEGLEGFANGPSGTSDEPSLTPVSTVPKKAAAGKRTERPAFSLGLVHGDSVVLHGDAFEYSIKRSGTGMLLFGSYVG